MSKLYYVEKRGVYSHGVFYINEDLDKCKEEADNLALNDIDDYHMWRVREYQCNGENDFVVYSTYKGKDSGDPPTSLRPCR